MASIKERRVALDLSLDMFATYASINPNIVARIEAGQMVGSDTERKALAALDAYESGKSGESIPGFMATRPLVDPELGYNPRLSWNDQPTRAAQIAARKALAAKMDAWRRERDKEDATRREDAAAKVQAEVATRKMLGDKLVDLRSQSGLSQAQMGAFARLSESLISRIERGKPAGLRNMNEVVAAYEAAARLGNVPLAPGLNRAQMAELKAQALKARASGEAGVA